MTKENSILAEMEPLLEYDEITNEYIHIDDVYKSYKNINKLINRKVWKELGVDERTLYNLLINWGKDKEIVIDSTQLTSDNYLNATQQLCKTLEEVSELLSRLNTKNPLEVYDAYGDILVTLHMGMANLGIDPHLALCQAYDVISKRKGKTENGIFIKDTE